jgi:hypothetical protein
METCILLARELPSGGVVLLTPSIESCVVVPLVWRTILFVRHTGRVASLLLQLGKDNTRIKYEI